MQNNWEDKWNENDIYQINLLKYEEYEIYFII